MRGIFSKFSRHPKLSVIVVVYDMAREAPRTLQSLSTSYQMGVSADDYEIIVMDNGSPTPLGEQVVQAFGPNVRYVYIEDAQKSPGAAINQGAALSRGDWISVCIDGARMVTPGLMRSTLRAFSAYDDPTVATLGWHLGTEPQQRSVSKGYTKEVEDELLRSIGWPHDGYRLFEIGCLGGSAKEGCFRAIAESNTVAVRKRTFDALGGYDTRFDLPGGGLINLDFFRRSCERPGSQLVVLLGEGSFHQLHGGVSTNISNEVLGGKFKLWADHYEKIRGKPWRTDEFPAEYLGKIPVQAMKYIAWSCDVKLSATMPSDAGE